LGEVVSSHGGGTRLTVRGPETKATPAFCAVADGEWFGIVFTLGTFMPHLPPGRVSDRRDAELPAATKRSFWLHGSTWEFPSHDNADTFVGALVREGLLLHDPIVDGVLRGQPQGLSTRTIQHRFLRATGLSHRVVRQVERARRAAALLAQGVSIGDTVHEAGYFDQPQLTRALRRFHGQTPAHLARTSPAAQRRLGGDCACVQDE
jgi:hypothetical protein